MNINKGLFVFVSLFLSVGFAKTQNDWKLKSDKDSIKTFSRKVVNSKINAIKIESDFSARLSQFVSVILDVASYDDWVYNSKSTRLLKQVSSSELYYYSEVNFPWPATNRDFVSHMVVNQDIQTKTVNIHATNVTGWELLKKNIVRIDNSVGKWSLVPLGKDRVRVSYELQVDPGGELPIWLTNTFSSTGMVETFKNLRTQLAKKSSLPHSPVFIID